MISADPARSREVFVWAKSPNPWRRRAACVALIRGTREHQFFEEIVRLSNQLLQHEEEDEMVLKGLAWLLRETVKADSKRTVPYLMKIRKEAPRLVLRTACETLSPSTRRPVLA
jgi:3-methyladenine DNA glycosylase AlkD